jgi:tetratricopeptide (TPR) repeat protein
MGTVKRALLLVGVVTLAAAAVAITERLNEDRQYRQLLVDGERALGAGQTYAAIEAFSGALALRPSSMVAYYRRGEAYDSQGQVGNAVRDLRMAHSLAPAAPQPLELLGRVFDRRGEPAEAARWYAQAALLLKDADPSLLYSLALAHYRAGDPAAAREPLRRAIAGDGSLAQAHYLLGLAYRDTGEAEKAVAALQQALKLAPALLPAREELADLLLELGRDAEAAPLLSALAIEDPQVRRLITLALAELGAHRFDAALDALAGAEDAAPGDSLVALARGRVYLARAEQDGDRAAVGLALSVLESALSGTARRSEGLALYGRALYLSGDVAGAERLLREAVATTPVHPDAYAYLADAAERLEHPALAFDALRQLGALEGDTISVEARGARVRRLGRLALLAGNAAASVRFLETAITAGHTDAGTLGLLARARWNASDRAGARRALSEALVQAPDDPELLHLAHTIR